uniref:Uncharacterized protein n=1 Tax=Nelumbo nucifera TaxID=4432 RepID=A0A822ZG03_NELNU|nr:TPA_asm: hypothetical protein HUJ06_001660 [Nelumbo nucifera]
MTKLLRQFLDLNEIKMGLILHYLVLEDHQAHVYNRQPKLVHSLGVKDISLFDFFLNLFSSYRHLKS